MKDLRYAFTLIIIGLTGTLVLGSKLQRACPPIVSRSEWNALAPKAITYLPIPLDKVLLTSTATDKCFSKTNCSEILQELQRTDMNKKYTNDINFSYLIGGDGSVYEGVGWHKSARINLSIKGLRIGFIGDYDDVLLNEKMMDSLYGLLSCGVRQGEIKEDYELVGIKHVVEAVKQGDESCNILFCGFKRL